MAPGSPDPFISAGNPCRIIREITEADRDFYFKDRKFDVDDYIRDYQEFKEYKR